LRTLAAIGMTAFAVVVLAVLAGKQGMPIGIGPAEFLVLAVLTGVALLSLMISRRRWRWVLGCVACFVVAMLLTPADPISTAFVAVVLCVVYTLCAMLWRNPHKRPQGESGSMLGRAGP